MTPDYTASVNHFGGKVADMLPQPVVRMWPEAFKHGVKRPVRITVTKYYGIGQHYYVTVEEEANPVWNERLDPPFHKEPYWTEPWEDYDGKGRYFSKRCNTVAEAERFINETVAEHFSDGNYAVSQLFGDELKEKNGKWFYREGD